MTLTVSDIVKLVGQCVDYTENRVIELWGGKESLTALEIAALDIPVEDRLWWILNPELIGDKLYEKIGYKCVDRAVINYVLHCGKLEVEFWARRWLSGEDMTDTSAYVAEMLARGEELNDTADAIASATLASMGFMRLAMDRAAIIALGVGGFNPDMTWAGDDAAWRVECEWQLQLVVSLITEERR